MSFKKELLGSMKLMAPYDFSILKSDEALVRSELNQENLKATLVIGPSLFDLKAEEFINDFEEKWATDRQVKKIINSLCNLFKEKNQQHI